MEIIDRKTFAIHIPHSVAPDTSAVPANSEILLRQAIHLRTVIVTADIDGGLAPRAPTSLSTSCRASKDRPLFSRGRVLRSFTRSAKRSRNKND